MRQFGELEAVIMDRLWEWGRPALVREVVDDLHGDRPLAYTTVMTVMENLYRKGWLRRERDGRAWRYEPTRSRSAYTAALMNDALGTSADRRTALAHFVLQMSPHDVTLLQQALDQARGETRDQARGQARSHPEGGPARSHPEAEPGRRRLPVTIAAVLLAYAVGVATLGARMLARASYAVLAHERAHLTWRHHRLLAMARISRRALPFLPLMRDAEAQVERLVELHADDAATQARDPASLATALVVLAGASASAPAPVPAVPAPVLASAATDAVQRIHRLLRPAEPLGRSRRLLLRAAAAALVLGPLAMALAPAVLALALGRVPHA